MDTQPGSGSIPTKGVQFRMTISLGNVLAVLSFCFIGIVGWTNVQDRQRDYELQQAEQQKEITNLTMHQEYAAELNARQAAILDGLDKRVARIENNQDWKKSR